MNMQPPGWYPDPSGTPDMLRWWDGTAWADATEPAYSQAGPGDEYSAQEDEYQGWYGQPQQDEQAGYQAASYPPGAYDQSGYQQAGHDPGGYDQSGYQQAGHDPGAYQQGAYQQGAYQQAGYGQPQGHAPGWSDAGGGWGEPGRPWQGVDERPRKTWPWFVAGGTGFVVVVIVTVVALFATGVIGGSGKSPENPPPVAEPTTAGTNSQAPGNGSTSPVVGQINDAQAGISYAKLGGKWAVLQPGGDHGMGNWTAGQYQIAQAEYKPGQDYIATYASAPLSAAADYSGPDDLKRVATSLAEDIEAGYYPDQHGRNDVENKAVTVDGHQAWKITFTLSFPQAEANGWDFQSERVVVILIDRGGGKPPAAFYFTLPDNLPLRADMDAVVSSIKVSG